MDHACLKAVMLSAGLLLGATSIEEGRGRYSPVERGGELRFEENRGQTDGSVQFLASGPGYDLFLLPSEAVFAFHESANAEVLRMRLEASQASSMAEGLNPLPGSRNYLRTSDPKNWHTDIRSYSKVRIGSVYPGVDLLYYGKDGRLEYDFVLSPGAKPSQIRLRLDGPRKISISKGKLALKFPGSHAIRFDEPAGYQESVSGRVRIHTRYVMNDDGTVGFDVGDYDSSKPLIIDPEVVYSTYWGGSSTEDNAKVALDAQGNVYVAGTTGSPDFPKTGSLGGGGSIDAFVTKFDSSGNVIYSTVLGGSATELTRSVAVDAAGNAVVVGDTVSSDLPTVNPIQSGFHFAFCGEFGGICGDGFAARLNSSGNGLTFSTYLGSSGQDSVSDVTLDAAGNIYVIGTTDSRTFEGATPVRGFSGGRDAFVAKIPVTGGVFSYFTYLGAGSDESGNGIAADAIGNVYLTGVTGSTDFPTLNPIQAGPENFSDSAFVTKLNGSGEIAYSTYLSGHSSDSGIAIAVDGFGNAYVAGITSSTNFPIANAQQGFLRGASDAFVANLDASGSRLIYSTYLGGNDRENISIDLFLPLDIAVDGNGNAYVTGLTQSSDFPAINPFQAFGGGQCSVFPFITGPCPDAFISKFSVDGKLLLSSPIGGNEDDRGRGIAVGRGAVYVVGTTRSANFPVKAAIDSTLTGFQDLFIQKISDAPPACLLPGPVLLSPSGGVSNSTPAFSWNAVPGAESYAVFLSTVAQVILTGTPSLQLLGFTPNTSFTGPALPNGDYAWMVVPRNNQCGWGQASEGLAFTIPATCPASSPVPISPVNLATVNNPATLKWGLSGPATISIVHIFVLNSGFIGQYPTTGTTFTVPTTLSLGTYAWNVTSWSSSCGAMESPPAFFWSSGTTQ